MTPTAGHWEAWSHFHERQLRSDRVPIMQAVVFEPSAHRTDARIEGEEITLRSRMGLSVNVSSAGLCLLVEERPVAGEIWRVRIQSSTHGVQTPTLAEVRWARTVPFVDSNLVIVGLRFIL
jgi:hypothetical protein